LQQEVIFRETGNGSNMAQQLLNLIGRSCQCSAEQHCSKTTLCSFWSLKKVEKLMDPLSTTNTASSIQMDYINLLVAQLQNQNPLEPMDNNEMASQLAQFSQLQQLETMNASFTEVLTATQRSYANSLLDKTVTFYSQDEITGELDQKVGTVDSVFHDPETQEVLLGVNVGEGEEMQEYTLSLSAVILVEN
jgi:flagellar basal-body rod modification protein FlgD